MNAREMAQFMARMQANRDDDDETPKPKIDPHAAIMRLKEAAVRYQEADEGPRFAVGDIITPAADATVKNAGNPHVVIAHGSSEYLFHGEATGHITWGARRDMRVLCFSQESICPFWVDSAEFIPWSDKR